jgi:hypothetical protein
MSNIGTSDISALPADPNSTGGVELTVREQIPANVGAAAQAPAPAPQPPKQSAGGEQNSVVANDAARLSAERASDPAVDIGKVVNGIQTASQGGLLTLPARDVPMTTTHLVQDAGATANHIPGADKGDYISDQMSADEIVRMNARKAKAESTGDMLFSEFSLPILIAALYFAFQLPVVRRSVVKALPILCADDGNFKITGYLAMSILFGGSVYAANKLMNHLSI